MFSRIPLVFFIGFFLASCAGGTASAPRSPEAPVPVPTESGLPAESHRLGAVLSEAASAITPESSLQHLASLSHDSMMGRDTERPEIWVAARYIADQFRATDLEPMDEDGDFIDEYPITIPEMDCEEVRMVVEAHGDQLELRCGEDFAITPVLEPPKLGTIVLTSELEHRWYRENDHLIPDGSLVLAANLPLAPQSIAEGLRFASWMMNVMEAGAAAVGQVLPPAVPREVMPAVAQQLAAQPMYDGLPLIMMLPATVDRIFGLAGLPTPDMPSAGAVETAPVTVSIRMPVRTRTITAPNVVARLPGARQGELHHVVLTAHFDHEPPGVPTPEGDSIFNGADDNASGTVGLLEVARAFAALPEPPARSVVFAAVSAEEMGLLGSNHLAESGPAPATSTAANLNMDMLSRNGPDSLFVFGQTYSSLGEVFQQVLEEHPELGFRVRPGLQWPEIDLIRFSDQASYLERGVPALLFNSGFHPELHTPDDEVELADTEKLARAARLMFYLAYAVASDPSDPVWTREGKARAEGMARRLKR